jgi:hypothetical protein
VVREGVGPKGWEALGESKRWDLAIVLLLGGHLVWLFSHFHPITVGPDAGGLLVQARLIATEFATGFRPDSPLQFLGSHWLETLDGDYHSRYPPGLPSILAVLYWIGGPRAPFLLNPLLASAVVGLTYLIGRRWLGRAMAFWAAAMVAALPILNRLALHGDAHPAAAALLLLGVLLLFRWDDDPSPRRAVLAGLTLGALPLIRYPETVVGVAVLAFFVARRPKQLPSQLLAGGAGAAVPFLSLLVYNTRDYGSPWRTGYGFTNEQFAFSVGNLTENLPTYLGALVAGEAGFWFVLGLVGFGWMAVQPSTRHRAVLLGGSVLSLTLLYAAYYWGAQEETDLILRYFLATLPILALGSAWLAKVIRPRWVAAGGLAIGSTVYLVGAIPGSSAALLEEWVGNARGEVVAEVALESVPDGSVIIARREIQDMLDYFGRWRLVDDVMLPGTPAREEATLVWELAPDVRARLEGVPTPVQITKAVESRTRYVGLGDQELASLVLADMIQWTGGEAEVFWLGKPSTLDSFADIAGAAVRVHPIRALDLPGWGSGTILPAWVPKAPLVLFRIETQF